jgi:hypothetical protein
MYQNDQLTNQKRGMTQLYQKSAYNELQLPRTEILPNKMDFQGDLLSKLQNAVLAGEQNHHHQYPTLTCGNEPPPTLHGQ